VTQEELQTAARIVSMGCTADELGEVEGVEYWNDIPMVSQHPEGARAAIRTHVRQLVADLRTAE
jgi:hypothetical protein